LSTIPVFSAEISLYDDESEGLRVECSQKDALRIQEYLSKAHFTSDNPTVAIPGTGNIHNWVVFAVSGGSFANMKEAVLTGLNTAGVTIVEESYSSPGENHVELHLTNISVFDR